MKRRIFLALLIVLPIVFASCSEKTINKTKKTNYKSRNVYSMKVYNDEDYDLNSDGNLSLYEKAPYFNVFDKMYVEYRDNINSDKKLMSVIKKYNKTFRVASDNKDYIISDYKTGVCINKYIGQDTEVKIPEKLEGKKVIKLGAYIEYNFSEEDNEYSEYTSLFSASDVSSGIKSITLPKTIKYISNNVLKGISSTGDNTAVGSVYQTKHTLESIQVDKENPYYCSVDGILYTKDKSCLLQIPLNYKNSTVNVLQGTKAVYCASSQTTKKLHIPASVISFGESIKKNGYIDYNKDYPDLYTYPLNSDEIKNISDFIVDEKNNCYSSDNGVLFDKNKTTLIAYPLSNQRTKYTVPDSVKVLGFFDLSADKKAYNSLKELTINKNVKEIYFNCTSRISPLTIKGYSNSSAEDFVKNLYKYDSYLKDEIKFVALD